MMYHLSTHGDKSPSMKTALLKRSTIEFAESLIDRWFYGEEEVASVERFLSDSIDPKYQARIAAEEADLLKQD